MYVLYRAYLVYVLLEFLYLGVFPWCLFVQDTLLRALSCFAIVFLPCAEDVLPCSFRNRGACRSFSYIYANLSMTLSRD